MSIMSMSMSPAARNDLFSIFAPIVLITVGPSSFITMRRALSAGTAVVHRPLRVAGGDHWAAREAERFRRRRWTCGRGTVRQVRETGRAAATGRGLSWVGGFRYIRGSTEWFHRWLLQTPEPWCPAFLDTLRRRHRVVPWRAFGFRATRLGSKRGQEVCEDGIKDLDHMKAYEWNLTWRVHVAVPME